MVRHPVSRLLALLAAPLLLAACESRAGADTDSRAAGAGPGAASSVPCDSADGGLELADGFCATVLARDIGRARHVAVAPNGDVYVALGAGGDGSGGGVAALRDTTGDGTADVIARFGSRGGTGVALRDGWLYFGADDRIVRWRRPEGQLRPEGEPQVVVSDLPSARSHTAKPLAFDDRGHLYVNVGSPSNSCQEQDRATRSPGRDPCPELETRAGIWRYDADSLGQTHTPGARYATGLRNTVALTVGPDDGVWGAVHGRDQLHQNWPDLFTREESAEKPAEEFVRIREGDDFGWPYCYYDPQENLKVLAPEYGGDGSEVGRCGDKEPPLLDFPAHWAPNGLLFYTGRQFPEHYRGGAFIAFHGSWNRAPLPQEGYKVVFVPFHEGGPTAEWEPFAESFREPGQGPREADHRPVGLAQGPDGSLYVTDDAAGWVWRIQHEGEASNGGE